MENRVPDPFQVQARPICIKFTKFDGDDLDGWIFQSNQFFEIDQTPEDAKVKIVVIHLEGKALQWHQNFTRIKTPSEFISWIDYVKALEARFKGIAYADPMSDLKNLHQKGTLLYYIESFEQLLTSLILPLSMQLVVFLPNLNVKYKCLSGCSMPRPCIMLIH